MFRHLVFEGLGNPEQQTGIMAKNSRYEEDIATLVEVRFSDEDQLTCGGQVHNVLERQANGSCENLR